MKLPRPDAAMLKRIAVLSMLIDHAAACFLNVARGADGRSLKYSIPMGVPIYEVCRGIGRTALPIFCFLLVEGFHYTRDRRKYLFRLLLFGCLAQPFFENAIYFDHSVRRFNTLFTLAIGFAAIWTLDKLRDMAWQLAGSSKGKKETLIRGMLFCAGCAATAAWAWLAWYFHTDYRYGGVLAIVLLDFFRGVREIALTAEWACLCVYSETELLAFPGILLCRLYNGERGHQHKYAFYLFYPAHLALLYLIRLAATGQ